MSRVLDILNSPWAVTEEKLKQLVHIYQHRAAGGSPDLAAVERALEEKAERRGKAEDDDDAQVRSSGRGYQVIDGVAIVEIHDVMSKRMSFMAAMSGGTSTQMVQAAFLRAMDDDKVHCVILDIDSPGGTVDGTQLLADSIRGARGKGKPIYAVANGQMCSAAYWVGSAADKIYLADETTDIGSIGVVCTHVDASGHDEKEGYKVTEITAGRYKRVVSQHAPLSEAGSKTLQDMVDTIYTIFVRDVALNRNVSEEAVLKMAEGRVYMGQAGIDIGLADGFSTLPALIMANCKSAEAPASGNGAAVDEGGEGQPAVAAGSASPPSGEPAEVVDVKAESGSPKDTNAASSGDGGVGMAGDPKVYSETQLREKLGLIETESLDEVLAQMGLAHKALADGDHPDVVGYYELARVEGKLKASERQVYELKTQLSEEQDGRKADALKQRAMLVCEKGRKQGRLTKKQIDAWALKDAMKDPDHFERVVLPSMPRMFSTEDNDDDNHGDSRPRNNGGSTGGEEDVRLDATQAYRERMKDMIVDAKTRGITMSRLEAANKIAIEEPEIAEAYMKESRSNGEADD